MTPQHRSPYSDEFLKDMRNRLFWARQHLRKDYEGVADQALQPSGQDEAFESPATYGTETYMQEIDLSVLEGEAMELREIEEALARIDERGDRSFGMCSLCVDERRCLCSTCPWIGEERLRFLPWVANCAQVQERIENGKLP